MKTKALYSCATLAFVNRGNGVAKCGVSDPTNHLARNLPLCQAYTDDVQDNGDSGTRNSRRSFLDTVSKAFVSSMVLAPEAARAACLSGDIRAECIGVYKLPIDAAESPYVKTPEMLKAYAPDLQWVPPVEFPKSYGDALAQMKEQRAQLDATKDLVAKGEIEKAGLAFLDMNPKVRAAGIVILTTYGKASMDERNAAMKDIQVNVSDMAGTMDGNPSTTPRATALEMKFFRIQYALDELTGFMGETDVMIGQGLRGDLGVSAPAQIQILSNIGDCQREFDNLLMTVPEKPEI